VTIAKIVAPGAPRAHRAFAPPNSHQSVSTMPAHGAIQYSNSSR
jgi:hypothetical protein